jgi:hypothetical protein
MPPSWVEALSTATSLINILPTKTLDFGTPHLALLGTPLAYDHLWVFGCKCYPNLSATASHKLTPRSTLCAFLGYSAHHKGYRCLDMSSNQIIIFRHIIFDETAFPFAERDGPSTPVTLEFLDASDTVLAPIGSLHKLLPAGPSPGHASVAPPTTSTPAPRAAPSPAPRVAPSPVTRGLVTCTEPTRATCGHAGLFTRATRGRDFWFSTTGARHHEGLLAPTPFYDDTGFCTHAGTPAHGHRRRPPRRQPSPHDDSGKARFLCTRSLHRHFTVSGAEDVPWGPCGPCLALRHAGGV